MANTSDSGEARPKRRGCAGLFVFLAMFVAAGWGAGLGVVIWILDDDAQRTMEALDSFRPKLGSKVYSGDVELLGQFAIESREYVGLNEIPLQLQKAFLATEDDEFYDHKGFRPLALANAAVDSLRTGNVRGASTITQQVVRNVDQTGISKDVTINRKLKEIVYALQLERSYTKDEILEIYLNQIFLGVSAYGVKAAAAQYFSKDVWDLTLGECAMLAGLTRSPNNNNPFRNPKNSITRRNIVLTQMLENDLITQEEHDAARAETIEGSVVRPDERLALPQDKQLLWRPGKFEAPYFVEEVRQFISRPPTPYEVGATQDELFEGGLEIHTTIDMRLQRAADELMTKALEDFDEKKLAELTRQGKEAEFKPVSGALICLDNRPGYEGFIRAMVGGRDFETKKFNTATQALRQPGSSVKPFVWLAAVDNGWTASDMVNDSPYIRPNPWGAPWAPKNFDGIFRGPITLRHALEKSVNIVSIKLVERLTMPVVRSYLEAAGFKQPIPNEIKLTLALGTPETTVLDQAVCYSTIANLGMRTDPTMITEIRDRDGIVRYNYETFRQKKQVLPADACYATLRLMEGVCEADYPRGHYPSGRRTEALARPRAGKTGTTNDSKDAWFCGFTAQFTCIVWIGYEDSTSLGRGNPVTGGALASPIWTDFMLIAHEGLPVEDFTVPAGVEFYDVDRIFGTAGGKWREAFIRDKRPPVKRQELRRPENLENLLESL